MMLLINSLHGTPIPVFDDSENDALTPEEQYTIRRKNVIVAFGVIRESEACIPESLLNVDSLFTHPTCLSTDTNISDKHAHMISNRNFQRRRQSRH